MGDFIASSFGSALKATACVEISATVSEAVAEAFEDAKAFLAEGSAVTLTNIAGAGFEPATSGL